MNRARKGWLVFAALFLVIAGTLATVYITRKPEPKIESKRYAMTGVVLGVKDAHHLSIANDDIAGFMSPMVMDYEVKDPAQISGIKRGDQIRATLLSDGKRQWLLEDLTVEPGR